MANAALVGSWCGRHVARWRHQRHVMRVVPCFYGFVEREAVIDVDSGKNAPRYGAGAHRMIFCGQTQSRRDFEGVAAWERFGLLESFVGIRLDALCQAAQLCVYEVTTIAVLAPPSWSTSVIGDTLSREKTLLLAFALRLTPSLGSSCGTSSSGNRRHHRGALLQVDGSCVTTEPSSAHLSGLT